MDFTLDEAIRKLKNAGLIVEDTETHDDDYREVDDALNDPKQLKKMSVKQVTALNQKRHDIHFQHSELDVKAKHAKLFNLRNKILASDILELDEDDVIFRTYDYNELLYIDFGNDGDVEIAVDPEEGWFHVYGELFNKRLDKSVGNTESSVINYLTGIVLREQNRQKFFSNKRR